MYLVRNRRKRRGSGPPGTDGGVQGQRGAMDADRKRRHGSGVELLPDDRAQPEVARLTRRVRRCLYEQLGAAPVDAPHFPQHLRDGIRPLRSENLDNHVTGNAYRIKACQTVRDLGRRVVDEQVVPEGVERDVDTHGLTGQLSAAQLRDEALRLREVLTRPVEVRDAPEEHTGAAVVSQPAEGPLRGKLQPAVGGDRRRRRQLAERRARGTGV